jgi:hypothetical protein
MASTRNPADSQGGAKKRRHIDIAAAAKQVINS